MYKIEWKKEIGALLIILLMAVAGAIIYPDLPEEIPMHWNIAGEVDSYYPKSLFSVFLLPGITVLILLLMLFMPYIDPKKERYGQFQGAYRIIRYSFVFLMAFIFTITMGAALGYDFIRIEKLVPGGIAILFIVIGIVLPRIKTNWFVGIRTPWTIENEEVWKKTHSLGSVMFSAAGVLTLFSLFLPPVWSFSVMFASIMAAALIPAAYSYFLYRKVTGK